MTSKERMMLAINREKPDRMPVTIHQWQTYHLKKYMNGMSDMEANKSVGFDAAITYSRMSLPACPSWLREDTREPGPGYDILRHRITTPEGVLTWTEGDSPATTWVIEHMIKNPEDIQLIKKYRPVPQLDRQGAVQAYDRLGDDGILRSFVCGMQGGCWQDACELYGVENLIYATYDDPDWVHEFLQILLDEKLRYIAESLPEMPFDLIEMGGGASSNTVISPDIHREFCLPYDRQIHDALHALGYKVVYHTCGGMTKIPDLIVKNGCDASETLSPAGMGGDIVTDEDAIRLRDALKPYVGIIGGMDQFNILEKGSAEQIERETERLFRIFGEGGGYICSACDHFFEVPKENLEAFAKAARKCVY